jgi:hypothetical protein
LFSQAPTKQSIFTKNKFYVGIKNEAPTNTLALRFLDYTLNGLTGTPEKKNMVQDGTAQIKAANPLK